MNIENILVISDKKDKQQKALAHSKVLAERYDAKIHVLGFTYENLEKVSPSLDKELALEFKQQILRNHQQWLSSEIEAQDLSAQTSSEVVWEKDIAAWVKRYCKANPCSLIVKTGHRSEGMFYVPTDWHLLRNGTTPILLVAEKKWRKKRSIMVSLDLATKLKSKQALNKKLVDAGIALAKHTGMPLHFCFSLAISPVLKDLGLINKSKAVEKAQKEYLPLIQEMAGDYSVSEEQIHIKAGEASKIIPSVASKIQADLVIVGSVGRKGIKAKLMGNTAESVLTLLKTDVLVIQP